MNNKGIIFTIDGLIAILLVSALILVCTNTANTQGSKLEEYQINQRIGDILITSQILEINNIYEIKNNYIELIGERNGYIKLNTKLIWVGERNNLEKNLISQKITYINISNKEIYIEVGVYI